jgi:DNA adenine methylase
LAATIVEQLGPHQVYFEPFAGSMSVLLSKPRAAHESLNDLNQELMNLALSLREPETARWLWKRADLTLFHEGFLGLAKARVRATQDQPPTGDPARALEFLVYSWFARSGTAGTAASNTRCFRPRYTPGGNGATHWASVVQSVPWWHERLRRVEMTCRDGFDVLAKVKDRRGVSIYVDPPYVQKGAKYKHDFEPPDHHRLSESLHRFKKARVVVSYYAHPLVNELYAGWDRLGPDQLGVQKKMLSCGMRDRTGVTQAPELLLTNGPILGRQRELFEEPAGVVSVGDEVRPKEEE